jgi:hypothetical protein
VPWNKVALEQAGGDELFEVVAKVLLVVVKIMVVGGYGSMGAHMSCQP